MISVDWCESVHLLPWCYANLYQLASRPFHINPVLCWVLTELILTVLFQLLICLYQWCSTFFPRGSDGQCPIYPRTGSGRWFPSGAQGGHSGQLSEHAKGSGRQPSRKPASQEKALQEKEAQLGSRGPCGAWVWEFSRAEKVAVLKVTTSPMPNFPTQGECRRLDVKAEQSQIPWLCQGTLSKTLGSGSKSGVNCLCRLLISGLPAVEMPSTFLTFHYSHTIGPEAEWLH